MNNEKYRFITYVSCKFACSAFCACDTAPSKYKTTASSSILE